MRYVVAKYVDDIGRVDKYFTEYVNINTTN